MASLGGFFCWLFHHCFSVREWFVLHLLLVYVFIVSGVFINCLQLLSLFMVRPFSLSLYRRLNVRLAWFHWSQLTFLAEWWSGSDCQLVMEEDEDVSTIGDEDAIVIMNHKYDIDWLMGWIMAGRHGVLGSSKVYAKSSLKMVPLVGSTWWFTESIFLKRNYESDKRTMEEAQAALQSYPVPFWILLFCEGTRFTENKHSLSMEVARKKGLPELKHHLLPRPKGFAMAVNGFRDKITCIYDTTLCVPPSETAPTLKNILYGRRCYAEMLVRRIPISKVPLDNDEETGRWLHGLYQEKDGLFERFVRNGTFIKSGVDASSRAGPVGDSPAPVLASRMDQLRLRKIPTRRSLGTLFNFLFWVSVSVPPILYYLSTLLATGDPYIIGAVLFCVALLYVGRRLLLGITQIEKGSSFGLKSNNNLNHEKKS